MLAQKMSQPQQRIIELVFVMFESKLISKHSDGSWHPAKNPDELTLADISLAMGAALEKNDSVTSPFAKVAQLFAEPDASRANQLGQVSWSALAKTEN
jgi:hypothetical protein